MKHMEKYNVEFKGYRRDCNAKTLPKYSGIYMIYRCTYNEERNNVKLHELFYIGQSKNLNNEVNYHSRHKEFLDRAKAGEEICYAYAIVKEADLDIVENALVYMQKPDLNENLVDNYNHDEAEFHFSGMCSELKKTDYKITEEGKIEDV